MLFGCPCCWRDELCTGNSQLNYFKAGHILNSKSSTAQIEIIETKGSLDNLDKVTNGECDGAFVQSDVHSPRDLGRPEGGARNDSNVRPSDS